MQQSGLRPRIFAAPPVIRGVCGCRGRGTEGRSRQRVPDRTGNEDLARTGKVRDPRGGMHGYATNVIVSDLDLAGMQAAAHFDPKGS